MRSWPAQQHGVQEQRPLAHARPATYMALRRSCSVKGGMLASLRPPCSKGSKTKSANLAHGSLATRRHARRCGEARAAGGGWACTMHFGGWAPRGPAGPLRTT